MSEQEDTIDSLSNNYKDTLQNSTSNGTVNALFFGEFQEIRQPVYGYLFPSVGALTLCTNVSVCVVLLKKINPVNMLLTAISVADLITALATLPVMMYIFTFSNSDWVPYEWCTAFKLTLMHAPATAHTISIWLTVVMAAQRLYVVRKPFMSYKVTNKKTGIMIGLTCFFGISVNFMRFVDSHFDPVVIPSKINDSVLVRGCVEVYEPWITDLTSYFSICFLIRAISQSFFPSILLLALNTALISNLHISYKRRAKLKNSVQKSNSKDQAADSVNTRTTIMLVAVSVITLCAEIPSGVGFSVIVLSSQLGFTTLDPVSFAKLVIAIDVLLLLSYPLNFVLYCSMSSVFRETFCGLFLSCLRKSTTNVVPDKSAKGAGVVQHGHGVLQQTTGHM